MFTQCSKCETVYRLSAEVLRAASGQVRCGRCGEVFNALARLAETASGFHAGESAFDMETRADNILHSIDAVPPAETVAPPGKEIAHLEIIEPVDELLENEASFEFTVPPGDLDRVFIETSPSVLKLLTADHGAPAPIGGAGAAPTPPAGDPKTAAASGARPTRDTSAKPGAGTTAPRGGEGPIDASSARPSVAPSATPHAPAAPNATRDANAARSTPINANAIPPGAAAAPSVTAAPRVAATTTSAVTPPTAATPSTASPTGAVTPSGVASGTATTSGAVTPPRATPSTAPATGVVTPPGVAPTTATTTSTVTPSGVASSAATTSGAMAPPRVALKSGATAVPAAGVTSAAGVNTATAPTPPANGAPDIHPESASLRRPASVPPNRPAGLEVSEDVREEMLSSYTHAELPQINEPRRALPHTAWLAGAIVLALLFVVQLVVGNRDWLAVHAPLLGRGGPTSADLVNYQLRQWGVTGDPAAKGTLRVRASVLNTAARLEPYPLLRVTLANRFGTRIGQREFGPSEYLGKPVMRLLSPGEHIDATLDILDPGKDAEGFEIDVCLRAASGKLLCAGDAAPATGSPPVAAPR